MAGNRVAMRFGIVAALRDVLGASQHFERAIVLDEIKIGRR